MVPLHGASQGFALLIFKDRSGKTPDQLLVATSEGMMRVVGDQLVPALPSPIPSTNRRISRSSRARTPTASSSATETVSGPCGGTALNGSMRAGCPIPFTWRTLLPRIPTAIFGWAAAKVLSCASRLRLRECATLRQRLISAKDGIPAGLNGVSYVIGDLYAGINNDQNIYRWDRAAHKFVVDNRLQLPLDVPKASPQVWRRRTAAYGLPWCPPMRAAIARVTRNADGSFHLDEDTYKPLTHLRICRRSSIRWERLGDGRLVASV